MIITYERGPANNTFEAEDWIAQRWWRYNDTMIFHEFWDIIKYNQFVSFEELYPKLLDFQKNMAKSKAYCSVYEEPNEYIQFFGGKGVFPKIIIYKKEFYNGLQNE